MLRLSIRSLRPILSSLFFLLLSSSVYSASEAFHQRFEFVRDADGQLLEVRDRTISARFSTRDFISQLRSLIVQEQELMAMKHDYFYEVEDLFAEEMMAQGDYSSENLSLLIRSLERLQELDVDAVFDNSEFHFVLTHFETRMTKFLSRLNPNVLARLDDPTFFYVNQVSYQVVTWGLDLARRLMSNVPVLNTVSYVIKQAEQLFVERRIFHQNILLHYLQEHEDELDLTTEEVNHIFSSIYESRIAWFAFWESRHARENWDRYGIDRFYAQVRSANSRLRNNRHRYRQQTERYNYAFQEVITVDGDHLVVNLFDRENMFASRPATAINLDRPQRVARQRVLLQLGELGVSFLPIPSFTKSMATSYFQSFYKQQKVTEGALFGYFESRQDRAGKELIISQYLNPFDQLLIID